MGSCIQKNKKEQEEQNEKALIKEVIVNFPKLIDLVSTLKDQVDSLERKVNNAL